MWLDGIKRFASRLGRVHRKSRALAESVSSRAPCDTEFDTTWTAITGRTCSRRPSMPVTT